MECPSSHWPTRSRPDNAPFPTQLTLARRGRGQDRCWRGECLEGAKLSEHGKANALDIHSLRLANGKVVELTDPHVPKDFREGLRKSACAQFTTVLGPGSDSSHEDHIHVDLLERRGGYRICEWDVREPGETPPAPAFAASVPLPRARPAIDCNGALMLRRLNNLAPLP